MTPQQAESKNGVETMHKIHAIADFQKHFEKFRSEPFKSSLLYWMMTGTVSGNFAITIDEFVKEMQMDGATALDTANKIIFKEQGEALSSALKEIAELHAKVKHLESFLGDLTKENQQMRFGLQLIIGFDDSSIYSDPGEIAQEYLPKKYQ